MQNFTPATDVPSHDMERRLALAWAKLLHLDVRTITTADHFFKAGGDSVRAMELVSKVRTDGLTITVADIIKYPELGAMSRQLRYCDAENNPIVAPFSLLTPDVTNSVITEAIAQDGILRENIEDIYPCSPLQEGLIALSVKKSGAYVTHDVYEIADSVDILRFQKAWEATVEAHPILRTRIMQVGDNGLFQVVAKGRIRWRYFSSQVELIEKSHEKPKIGPGGELSQYAIVDQQESTKQRFFVWSAHHAIYDGWSRPLLLQAFEQAYATLSDLQAPSTTIFDPPPAYNRFIKFISEIDAAASKVFWGNYLTNMTAPAFPSLPHSRYEPVPSKTLQHCIKLRRERPPQATIPTMIELAWMMIVSAHTGSDDVVIGVTVSGRNAPVDGILEMTGPTIATVPRRIHLHRTQNINQVLNHLQEQSMVMIPFEQTGLRQIRGFGPDPSLACDFQNLLIIQPIAEEEPSSLFNSGHKQTNLLGVFNSYALMLECTLTSQGISVVTSFDEEVISSAQMRRIVNQFERVLLQINAEVPGSTIGSIDMISADDITDIKKWNTYVPDTVNVCIHDLVVDANRAHPGKEIICSWDGALTFAQLDDLSLRLAYRLASLGVKTEDFIPLCFEKSMWAIVAILAVLKSGAAFTMLSHAQPPERLQHMMQQVNARILLASAKQAERFSDSETIIIVVVDSDIRMLSSPKCWSVQSSPSTAAFAVFTSGSTGTPKCVVVEHKAFSTSALAHGLSERLTRSSRVLQFADYAFDVAISDILTTLVFGACVCVPSEHQRVDDLDLFINDMAVTDAFLTPTVARLLKPAQVPSLKTLKLGGEALTREDLLLWSNSTYLINSYGVAECAVRSTFRAPVSCTDHPSNIGFSVGCACWIVNTHDYNVLAPIGTIGELVIEGPTLARGYFDDSMKTAGSFVKSPSWLSCFRSMPDSRLYRTGDLVCYDDDGSIIFKGRKDSQIKLRGQRIELEEIEYQLHRLVPDINYVVCDIVLPSASSVTHQLVTFYRETGSLPLRDEANENILLPPEEHQSSQRLIDVEVRLRDILPAYMIPSFFLPVRYLPQTVTGKIDRRKLRNVLQGLSLEELRTYAVRSPENSKLSTPLEVQLAKMWCQVLSPIDVESIGPNDSFFRLGGDSVLAMHLAALARRKGYFLTVASIFQNPKLTAQAKIIQSLINTDPDMNGTHAQIAPFSLLAEAEQRIGDVQTVRKDLTNKLNLRDDMIENAYPCTPLQEGLMALSIKHPGAYVSQHIFDLPPDIDLALFRRAWDTVVRKNAILRTVILQDDRGVSLQVVLSDMALSWLMPTSLDDYLERDRVIHMNYGHRLARYALVQNKSESGQYTFVWTAHHAVYDGWSLSLLLRQVAVTYRQQPLERSLSFDNFLYHILGRDRTCAERYWSEYLEGAAHVPFPPSPLKALQPNRNTVAASLFLARLPSDFTLSTVIRAAWAIIVSKYSMSEDIVFGSTLAGRNDQLEGIEDMVGPTITTVPIRVRLREDDTIALLMSRLQDESSLMISFEHFGLRNIGRLSSVLQGLCQFQNLLVVHPVQNAASEVNDVLGHLRNTRYSGDFLTYPLVVECFTVRGGVEFKANFDSTIINNIQTQRLLFQLKSIVSQLCDQENQSRPLNDMTWISPEDEIQIRDWNNTMPERSLTCIHDAIHYRCCDDPRAEAVCAWDGSLTYAELDDLSSSISNYLLDLGLQNEECVPFCFEKSKWAVIAQLAILKAGGACVPLDPAHPLDRKKVIASKTHAQMVLTSKFIAPSLETLVRNLIVVDENLFSKRTSRDQHKPRVSSQSPAFIMFTSGSTGTPKGIIIEHATTYSSARDHGVAMRLSPQSRVFQFSSYAFDVAVFDIFTTLLFGGCVCIPSDSDRMNMKTIAGVVADMRINWALLTPSYVRLLRPNDFQSLRTLLLCGEAVPQDLVDAWRGKVSLLNAYGPTESSACVVGEIHENTPSGTIGKAVGGLSWIVDPRNHDLLVPVGAVGELLIEGPVLARGYLDDEARTASSFIFNPSWATVGSSPRRFYKSGDLVKYNVDGTIQYIGRKDTQVKLRGQRIEIDEVEYHLRACLPSGAEAIVGIITPADLPTSVLTAFLCVEQNTEILGASGCPSGATSLHHLIRSIERHLRSILPTYMVPGAYVQLQKMPSTISGKIDRGEIRRFGEGLTMDELYGHSRIWGEKRVPSTEAETVLADLWTKVLKIKTEKVGADDSFFELGGDSINAIALVSAAHGRGILLTVQSIFKTPRLSELALALETIQSRDNIEELAPFDLFEVAKTDLQVIPKFAEECGVNPTLIEDAYPCTPLQQGLLALSSRHPGAYMAQFKFALPSNINIARLQAVWGKVVANYPILRTRIVQTSEQAAVQIVLKEEEEDIDWRTAADLEKYSQDDRQSPMLFGRPLSRTAIISDAYTTQLFFAWTVHHAIFDGRSVELLIDEVEAAYYGKQLSINVDFKTFIQYTLDLNREAAKNFWQTYLADSQPPCFPHISSTTYQPLADGSIKHCARFSRKVLSNITTSSLLRAAWGLILARYSEENNVVFGVTLSGRSAPVTNVDRMIAPTIVTVPVRVSFDHDMLLVDFLRQVQDQANEMIAYEHFGLHHIRRLGNEAKSASDFRTILVIQPPKSETRSPSALLDLRNALRDSPGFHTSALVLDCELTVEGVDIALDFDTRLLDEKEAYRILHQLEHVIIQLNSEDKRKQLRDVELISPWDKKAVLQWNAAVPEHVADCIHSLIEKQALVQPHRPAVCSWDGEISYYELDHRSSLLAELLLNKGVHKGSHVPVCLEKSIWVVVAMLAILKTGGICAPLDPSHPIGRLKMVFETLEAKVVLTSSTYKTRFEALMPDVLVIQSALLSSDVSKPSISPKNLESCSKNISPSDSAFIVFTSGSTGTPKGIILEHRGICTSAWSHGKAMHMSSESRFLQFAAYSFDVSLGDIFTTLIFGGCVCIPSEQQRLADLAGAINAMNVNQACLTSSVARTIQPHECPGLKTLTLGGEGLSDDVVNAWADYTHLLNIYGPAECTIWCACTGQLSTDSDRTNIGRGVGAHLWIVDSNNTLSPVGCVGEIVVEGPVVARGYLNDNEKTKAVFMDSVPWGSEQKWRAYKTGDLGRLNSDGTISFIGRRDTQVKLRGQRLELGDIEYHLRKCLQGFKNIVVDLVEPIGSQGRPILAAFVALSRGQTELVGCKFEFVTDIMSDIRWKSALTDLEQRLSQVLPSYMVPSLFLPLQQFPLSSSGKLDRKRLRELASRLSTLEMKDYSLIQAPKRPISNAMEASLALLWQQCLGISDGEVGANDHFFRLGGDSIVAVQLATAARAVGISFSAADVFSNPTLEKLASRCALIESRVPLDVMPFSLLPANMDEKSRLQAALDSKLTFELVEDMYPCSSLQKGLFALSMKQPGSYVARDVFELPEIIDLGRFQNAWNTVVARHPILRTRIVLSNSEFIQVVSKEELHWNIARNLEAYVQEDKELLVEFGAPLLRLAFVSNTQKQYFVLSIHHSIYDGWSLALILEQVDRLYTNFSISNVPDQYKFFVKYLTDTDASSSKEFWCSQLDGAVPTPFPLASFNGYKPSPSAIEELHIPMLNQTLFGFTNSTIIRAAWALLLGQYLNARDITFGATVSGRDTPIANIGSIIGPTIATVPVHIKLDGSALIETFLSEVQAQATAMIPFQHLGLSEIQNLSEYAQAACDFQTFLVIQPRTRDADHIHSPTGLLGRSMSKDLNPFNVYALMIHCDIVKDGIDVIANFDTQIIEHCQMKKVLQQFRHIIMQLGKLKMNNRLADIPILNPEDQAELLAFNKTLPEPIDECLHHLFEGEVQCQPNKEAVCAWDGSLTYTKLNELSSRLAVRLRNDGWTNGSRVAVCFEKSIWAVVSMMGVLKAGGTCVCLDPDWPQERLQGILQEVDATNILVSRKHLAKFAHVKIPTFIVTQALTQDDDVFKHTLDMKVSPRSAAFIIFTSGSTGRPKGIIIDHIALATGGHAQELNLGPDSRVLQFSSFTFDVGIFDIFTTLARGGCVCIPSDFDRVNNITNAMWKMRANWAYLTPSFIRTLNPGEQLPLETLVLGGEAVSHDNIDQWVDKVQLMNGYGPTEASICVAGPIINRSQSASIIGRPVGCLCWIVDLKNHDRLVPIGAVGELVVEGHVLAQAYLNDKQKTDSSFIKNPAWLPASRPNSRVYKTGDLAAYNSDGTIRYLGRRDSQVKIRGQRIELGEIEYRIRQQLREGIKAVVDVVLFSDNQSPTLAAFLEFQGDRTSAEWAKLVVHVKKNLAENLTRAMIPAVFLPLSSFPYTTSGKIDRISLKQKALQISLHDAMTSFTSLSHKTAPSTAMEKKLSHFWSQILSVKKEQIAIEDDFFAMGGDSIHAIRLSALARASDLALVVGDVFTYPTLASMAERCREGEALGAIAPFLLLDSETMPRIIDEVVEICRTSHESIEDIYPCTPIQEGLVALSMKESGAYVGQQVTRLSETIDLGRFKAAWNLIATSSPILRTRIVQTKSAGLLQVIMKEELTWHLASDLDDYLIMDNNIEVELGNPLMRFGIVSSSSTSTRHFVWTVHHALYDGWMLSLVFETLHQAYAGVTLSRLLGFNGFVKYVKDIKPEDAQAFWSAKLNNKTASPFPRMSQSYRPRSTASVLSSAPLKPMTNRQITTSSLIRTAWALLIARHTASNRVCFGTTLSGRDTPFAGIERVVGPTIATVPVCIEFNDKATVYHTLRMVQSQAAEMIPFQHFGLHNISQVHGDAKLACNFQTLILIQFKSENLEAIDDALGLQHIAEAEPYEPRDWSKFNPYALMIECSIEDSGIVITANFDPNLVPEQQMLRYIGQFSHILNQLSRHDASSDATISQVEVTSDRDKEEIMSWNSTQLKSVNECIHDQFRLCASKLPDAEAICAWDGRLTYRKLDQISTQLSHKLIGLGVQKGVFVPLCFEKSAWAIVSMLGVLKAGGACVNIDASPSFPPQRRKAILDELSATLSLCSPQQSCLLEGTVKNIIVFDDSLLTELSGVTEELSACISPQDAAFVVFTSGSTGKPKGIVLEHSAICSSIKNHGSVMRFNKQSRTLQFAAYTFDISLSDIFTTLLHGGCVCVPSEYDRLNCLTRVINELGVNQACLTPSVATLFQPSDVPSLKKITLGGEPLTRQNIKTWADETYLTNIYGPAECSMWCMGSPGLSLKADESNIGTGLGVYTWITRVENHNQLCAVGMIGELLIQGPLLAREYLNDPERTAAVFIENPTWFTKTRPEQKGRFYKTGDLVRYNVDGTIQFIGRKDSQVKIRGQRIELGEIEHCMRRHLGNTMDAAADVMMLAEQRSDATLIAFINIGADFHGEDEHRFDARTVKAFEPVVTKLKTELVKYLPSYMIPSLFVPLKSLPLTASGKCDHLRLRRLAMSLTKQQLATLAQPNKERRSPSTIMEMEMCRLWADILHMEVDTISSCDNFLALGGDSISAIRLVTLALTRGILLSVGMVFRHNTLAELSGAVSRNPPDDRSEKVNGIDLRSSQEIIHHICQLYQIEYAAIEDIIPATSFQAACVIAGLMQHRGYTNYFTVDFNRPMDLARLQYACSRVVSQHAILRTTFAVWKQNVYQIVHRPSKLQFRTIQSSEDLNGPTAAIITADQAKPIKLGDRFLRFMFLQATDSKLRLIIRISHAQYDGISFKQIFHDIDAAYANRPLPLIQGFPHFIRSVSANQGDTESFWQNLLQGSKMTTLVEHRQPAYNRLTKAIFSRDVASFNLIGHTITSATILKAAWALTLAQLTGTTDVVFGYVTSGRNAPIPGIEKIFGPCMAIIPARISLGRHSTRQSLLCAVQAQQIAALDHELLCGFEHLIQKHTDWAPWTRFSSAVQYQNIDNILEVMTLSNDITWSLSATVAKADASDISIYAVPHGALTKIELGFCEEIITQDLAGNILGRLCTNLELFTNELEGDDPLPLNSPLSRSVTFPLQIPDSIPAASVINTDHLPASNTVPHNIPRSDIRLPLHHDRVLELVERAWAVVLSPAMDISDSDVPPEDTPFYSIWGNIIAAAQFVAFFTLHVGVQLKVEDIMENPTVERMVELLRVRLRLKEKCDES